MQALLMWPDRHGWLVRRLIAACEPAISRQTSQPKTIKSTPKAIYVLERLYANKFRCDKTIPTLGYFNNKA